MDSSLVLSSYSSRLNLSLANSMPMNVMTMLPKVVVLPVSGRLAVGSIPGLKGLRIQMGSNLSTSLVSISTRRNPKVSYTVSEVQETVVDLPPVTDGTWESLVLKADGPVLVEFWAPWCGPCRIIHPEIAELSIEYAGKIKFFKLNTDESPSIATKYSIRSIPTIMIFNKGQKKDAVIGAVPKTTLISTIEKFL